ncbi:MAG: hypothetical protein CL930_15155 [Deltaproteobacteria bacterium]|nr:hypothetical protein [Deltaproteobacteria bacterium]
MIQALLALTLSAQATTLYVNGTPVEGLRNVELKNVTVQVDENGDVFVLAPQYNVAIGDDAKDKKANKKDVVKPPAPTGDGEVPSNRWWLISEDNQSTGHVIDIEINGTVIQTFKSEGKALIFDTGPYLNMGDNQIRFISRGKKSGGGAVFLYLGTGSVDGGRVSQDEPKIKFKRNSQSPAKDVQVVQIAID